MVFRLFSLPLDILKFMRRLFFALIIPVAFLVGCSDKEYVPKFEDFQGLVITEVAANADKADVHSWVEIMNTSGRDIKLRGVGLYLSVGSLSGEKISAADGVTLKAGHRLVLSTEDNTLTRGISSESDFYLVLGMAADKDVVDRFDRDGLGLAGPTARYGSYQEMPEGSGKWEMTAQATRRISNYDAKPNGVWLWSTHMFKWIENDFAVMKQMKQSGYDHVLLNYNAFDKPENEAETRRFITKAKELGLKTHAWMQVFCENKTWINPVEDIGFGEGRYKQEEYDRIIAKANRYIDAFDVDGIHLDYIRFSGSGYNQAHRWNFSNGVTGVGAITEFCRQLRESVDARAEGVILSAALMSGDRMQYLYGQDPTAIGKYIDILMPMVYKYYASNTLDDEWMRSTCNRFTSASDAQVWAGIQTYTYPEGAQGEVGMTPSMVLSDAQVVRSTDCSGMVLFRYNLGEFPDVSEFWKGCE